mmetsp:Transcript_9912/g.25140  ORF Transcript_9912/g.25140 Transcript_9912/m.25140 type:complete len:224 (+) Transcript_9912:1279-1950(+)
MRICRLIGFFTNLSMPAARHTSTSSAVPPVMPIRGRRETPPEPSACCSTFRMIREASAPSMIGICKSRSTHKYSVFRHFASPFEISSLLIASSPLKAVSQANPAFLSIRTSTKLLVLSSSTTRMRCFGCRAIFTLAVLSFVSLALCSIAKSARAAMESCISPRTGGSYCSPRDMAAIVSRSCHCLVGFASTVHLTAPNEGEEKTFVAKDRSLMGVKITQRISG